jgi:hypothetical protein
MSESTGEQEQKENSVGTLGLSDFSCIWPVWPKKNLGHKNHLHKNPYRPWISDSIGTVMLQKNVGTNPTICKKQK